MNCEGRPVGREGRPVGRIKLTLAYDGTNFCGWQIQKSDKTVQQVLQDALTTLHKHPVVVTGSGGTLLKCDWEKKLYKPEGRKPWSE